MKIRLTNRQLGILVALSLQPATEEFSTPQVCRLAGTKTDLGKSLRTLVERGLLKVRYLKASRYKSKAAFWSLGPLADVLKEQGVLK